MASTIFEGLKCTAPLLPRHVMPWAPCRGGGEVADTAVGKAVSRRQT